MSKTKWKDIEAHHEYKGLAASSDIIGFDNSYLQLTNKPLPTIFRFGFCFQRVFFYAITESIIRVLSKHKRDC